MEDGTARRVILVMRDDYQIHDLTRETRRHVKGESCLHSTCLTAYHKLDNYGHVSTAVLNSLTNPNPWALFSRKLLVPDALIDCRFVGIGYNFSDPRREYLFVVWHIRTRQCPPTMLVPARQNVRYDDRIAKVCYDDPIWQTCEEVSQFDFEKAAVDRLVLERVLGIRFEDGRTGIHSPLVGFVRCNAFDLTHQNRQTPVRWFRDTVVLDLLRLYQQQIHRDRRAVSGSTPADLLADLLQHLRETVKPDRIHLDMELLAAEEPSEATACEPALRLVLRDEQRRPVHTFLVLAALTDRERLSTEAIESCQHQLRARLNGEDISALFVLQGVRSDQRYRLQGAVTVTTEQVPIHIIKVALLPSVGEPSVKDVAHGIIPVRCHAEGPVLGLLVTRSEDDELPRLPGGKVETEETVGQALVRELQEELDLEANEIQETFPVEKSGIVVRAVSPSTGRMTPYRFFPFVVRLNERGRARIKALVNQPQRSCWVAPVTLEVFRETGLGFDPTYARAILDQIPPEVLSQAAIVLE
jgi:8-oxo-dGTP pyrophosphatase MutT (NUDIX family)